MNSPLLIVVKDPDCGLKAFTFLIPVDAYDATVVYSLSESGFPSRNSPDRIAAPRHFRQSFSIDGEFTSGSSVGFVGPVS